MADNRNDGRQAPPAQQQQPNLSVLAQYVKDLSFENPGAPQSLRGRQTAPTINISINVHGGQIVNSEVEVELKLDVRAVDGETVLFAIELVYAGLFRLTNIPPDAVQQLMMIQCPQLLFPFARQIIADASRNGGFPPLMIDPVDFISLYRQRVAEMQARQPPRDQLACGWDWFDRGTGSHPSTPKTELPTARSPDCSASSRNEVAGRGPMWPITSAAARWPKAAQVAWGRSRESAKRKPAANRSPAPVVSTSASTVRAGTISTALAARRSAPSAPTVTAASLASWRTQLQRRVEVGGLVERMQFRPIGEEDVDRPVADQPEELVAKAVDAERIGKRQRDLASGAMGDRRGLAEGLLGQRRIPEIALEIGDPRRGDHAFVDVRRRQLVGGAEIGVHRPLAVGRDQDHRTGGRIVVFERRRVRNGCRGRACRADRRGQARRRRPCR